MLAIVPVTMANSKATKLTKGNTAEVLLSASPPAQSQESWCQLLQRNRATPYTSWNFVNCCTAYEKNNEKACCKLMILKVTQGHRNCRYSFGQISLPISSL